MEGGKLGKYEIRGTLGRGAMGIVYDAYDPVIARRVAIKTLKMPDPSDTEAMEELGRFRREAQAAGRLTHPNIVGVFDYGETDTLAYIVMEFVDGTTLKHALERQERLSPADAVRLLEEVLAGLQYSHERGVVHRDIKPGNIMLTRDGQAKIADFGIARIESSSMTQVGTVMGTPGYMSPEQFMGQTVDARTDIYSAGVVLYQLLTGERPFEGSMTAIMHKVLHTEPPHPSELSVTAPPALDPVVARAMAKRPDARYASAAAFGAALKAALAATSPVTAAATSPDPDATMVSTRPARPATVAALSPVSEPGPNPKRGRLPLLAGAALIALVMVGGGAYVAGMFTRPLPVPITDTAALEQASRDKAAAEQAARDQAAANEKAAAEQAERDRTAAAERAARDAAEKAARDKTAAEQAERDRKAAAEKAAAEQAQQAKAAEEKAARERIASLRQTIAAAITPIGCQLAGGDVDGTGAATITGMVGQDSDKRLRAAVATASPSAPTAWRTSIVTGPYCAVLDALRPIVPGFGTSGSGLDLALQGGDRPLTIDKDYIIPRVTSGDFPSYLVLDYFSSDGKRAPLPYQTRPGLLPVPPHRTVAIGDPKRPLSESNFPADLGPDSNGWQAGEPAGTDLMVAIASDKPLFAQPRSGGETQGAYFRDLRTALETARRNGARVEARVTAVPIAPR